MDRSSGHFKGKIDELTVYTRALSPCEIAAIYQGNSSGKCKGDTDGDSIADPIDNCPVVANVNQLDTDGDLVGDACDCAYDDGGAFANPPEISNLVVSSDRSTLRWCQPVAGTGTSYDVVSGLIATLPVTSDPYQVCAGNFVVVPSFQDVLVPDPGTGFWYVARARNYCHIGTYGFQTQHGTPTVERLPDICP